MSEGLVHGVGQELVEPDWPALTSVEVQPLLERYGLQAGRVRWVSPRPLSSAALVETAAGSVFVKRHSETVRTVGALMEEHAFVDHLRGKEFSVPRVLSTDDGESAVHHDGWTWEVFEPAAGSDTYRELPSWEPFTSAGHAFSAGVALARLQVAAADFDRPARLPHLLMTSAEALLTPSLQAGLESFVARRPALAAALAGRDWERDVAEVLSPLHERFAPYLPELGSAWTHGDGHASNLFWTDGGEVAAVIDFGLADRTTPIVRAGNGARAQRGAVAGRSARSSL